ncbi:valine--tRNA ligase [Candidatus Peregrinibacteria bacterium CG10_big_fil_rev_8_21_14_0_10_49_24]|nr:MAG: valine--tRNA ligase [Candidatus Peregrinibacteria bacterium CG11_big_fil_rev_8_21_14_0_20_49_14]PIR50880.1 MAG: valine--tRNA ligase [Candidatus Peregrinibacteria bacterium CG10_big_fil_rev_8_21_14_0_10_49_24]PJA67157.1 MAG: valine--tRNA ligase [Candidatus Peregrinibacteria bacterium CG_4_9_14_3_um_filter_49_12]
MPHLSKVYDPMKVEDRIYSMWEKSGAFRADNTTDKEPFTISMPPPNATGQLHLGHAVMLALEDIFIRFARMRGKEALWVPGTDHAAIATENVVIKKLKDEGIRDPREELGREKLVDAIKEFVSGSQDTIRSQIRKMGSSCDWSREAYTMDAPRHRLVNEVFCKMFADDLIYRGHRIVNWDPKLQTNVSDDEVEWEDRTDPFYTFRYGPFEIGTVRPETKFGDKYVVMHPDDKRYKKYKHGDTFECEWINGPITATIIKDESVDPEMGTGVMTITPWHSGVDFEIAERHGLDKEQVIDFEGKLLPIAGEFEGMRIEDARANIVEKLDSKGLLVKIDEKYTHTVALNSRGGGVIEPQIKLQWFIDVNRQVVQWKDRKISLKEVMQDAVRSGDINIIPERFEKTYFHWIDNLRDWCISRQIWWGHRIPVWYKGAEEFSGVQPPDGDDWVQDPDTLDTWFSSALWTWSTLVDPKLTEDYSLTLKEIIEKSPDIQKFHPTQVMETGYDILFFWVARMILMTTYATGEIPFKTVYLHGMIRARDGQKMSKSKPETMIDPLDIIPQYGADALRMAMIVGQSPGNDQKLYEEKIAGYRNFINKLWNASRFVLMQCEDAGVDPHSIAGSKQQAASSLSLADRALLSALQDLITDVTNGLADYRLSEVGERLYSFTWDYFCDWYLELSKGEANTNVLLYGLRTIVALLHPYCPFVTEELWGHIKPEGADMLLQQAWPVADASLKNHSDKELQIVIDVITAIRSLRSDQEIEPAKKITVIIHSEHADLLSAQQEHIIRMARLETLTVSSATQKHENVASVFLSNAEVHLSLEGLIDVEKEVARLSKEKEKLEGFIRGIAAKLDNEKFVQNAKEEVVEKEREKLAVSQQKLIKVEERLKALK